MDSFRAAVDAMEPIDVQNVMGSDQATEGQPSNRMLTWVIMIVTVGLSASTLWVRFLKPSTLKERLRVIGVAVGKVKRAAKEIERKTFHVCGLLVPLIHLVLLNIGVSQRICAGICWSITIGGWSFEFCRLSFPAVQRMVKASFMGRILRESEEHQLTGSVFFSLGCTMAISFFPPGIAMTSILFLVLGDMTAALIGVSFGGDVVKHKIGREGKKSVEGSVAMFAICFVIGCVVFNEVHLREYPVFVAALVATLTELHEPFGLNDNLTIPVFSSLALSWGMLRIHTCTREPTATAQMFLSLEAQYQSLQQSFQF